MENTSDHHRVQRARLSLDGLSIGDGYGQRFFFPWTVETTSSESLPGPPWHYTDDTEMAMAIVEVLETHGGIDQDQLASVFARRYSSDPARGYGAGAHELLRRVSAGMDWRTASQELFGGQGSFGNGGAMRAGPIGAWFADDVEATIDHARRSSEVTHAHVEGQAGAIAVALAAGWAHRWNQLGRQARRSSMLTWVADHLPVSDVRLAVEQVAGRSLDEWQFDIAREFGCGHEVTAMDTVPFCLWLAASRLDDYCDAVRTTALAGGDVDTTCAIVGSIVALATGDSGIPPEWRRSREPLNW